MSVCAGIDVGSAYTKALVLGEGGEILARAMTQTGFRSTAAAEESLGAALRSAGIERGAVDYVVATGHGRFLVPFAQLTATDLTAAAWGARAQFPRSQTVLDVGGHTVKALRVDESRQVKAFRLNEKCAAGTGAFLEKTAGYMGFTTQDIGPVALTATEEVPLSGVCTVFAEAEVINHLSQGVAPADILQAAILSLVGKSVQLMKRVKMEPEYTLIGGIMRFPTMVSAVREAVKAEVNVPEGELVQFVAALGAATLAQHRHRRMATSAGRS